MDEYGAMHPISQLTSVEKAVALITSKIRAIERADTVPLSEGTGRILANPIQSPADSPASDRSRMDGFAVSAYDLAAAKDGEPLVMKVVGKALAGAPFPRTLESMACVEIATGAELPMRADAVVPVEHVKILDGGARIEFAKPPTRGQFVLPRGGDYRAGEILVKEGAYLSAARIGAIASCGIMSVTVRARPRILVVPTGDEVRPADQPVSESHVRESNSHALAAFIALRGALPVANAIVPDNLEAVVAALNLAQTFDAAVFTGGSSAGERDFLAEALRSVGAIAFHGVAVRPGKPILFGQAGQTPVLGLPGNPTSCMVGAHLFLDRILQGLAGAQPVPLTATRLPLGGDVSSFVRGDDVMSMVLVAIRDGKAEPVLRDSMSVSGASLADGYFVVAPGRPSPAVGDTVAVVLMR